MFWFVGCVIVCLLVCMCFVWACVLCVGVVCASSGVLFQFLFVWCVYVRVVVGVLSVGFARECFRLLFVFVDMLFAYVLFFGYVCV